MNITAAPSPIQVEPFWERLHKIAFYPLQMSALIWIALYSVLRLLAGYLPGLVGFICNAVVLAAIYRYASDVLVRTAHGQMEAPEGWTNSEDDSGWTQLKVQAVFLLAIVAAFLVGGVWIGLLVALLLAFAAPGATMSAAIDGSALRALNPTVWFEVMSRIGGSYFLVTILYFCISVVQLVAAAFAITFLPTWLATLLMFTFSNFAIVATFHLMGYLIYQYHEELDWTVEARVSLKRPADKDQDLLDQSAQWLRDGNSQQAEDFLREQIDARAVSNAVHERYRTLLTARGDNAALTRHGQDYLNVLLAQNQDRQALDLLRNCLTLDANFRVNEAEYVSRLAHRAAESQQSKLALQLLSGFDKRFPRHADIPRNFLLAAKLLAENMQQERAAHTLLGKLREQYPHHALTPEIDRYLALLSNLLQSAPAPARVP